MPPSPYPVRIPWASLCSFPSTPVLLMRSLPARSTRCSFARNTVSLSGFVVSTHRMNMQWLRVDASFIGVSATWRFVSPRKSLGRTEPVHRPPSCHGSESRIRSRKGPHTLRRLACSYARSAVAAMSFSMPFVMGNLGGIQRSCEPAPIVGANPRADLPIVEGLSIVLYSIV